MQLNPHLHFDGQCEAAFRFYQQVFGGEIATMLTYAQSPMADQVPERWRSKILHASLNIDGATLTGADDHPGTYRTLQGFAVTIGVEDPAEAERIFHALADGGTVQMGLAETFWAIRFGMLVDRYSVPWMINCGKGE